MKSVVGPLFLFVVTFAVCIGLVAVPSSCGGTNCSDPKNALNAVCVADNILVQCAGGDVAGVITQYTPAVEDIIQKGLQPDGSINYASIESDLISAVAKYGWCVISAVFDHYMNPPSPAPVGSGSSAVVTTSVQGTAIKHQPTPQAAKDAFNKLRAKVWPHATFKVSSGTVL